MTQTTVPSLRDVCNDYYHGLLSKDAYRRQRARLLDAVIAGDNGDNAQWAGELPSAPVLSADTLPRASASAGSAASLGSPPAPSPTGRWFATPAAAAGVALVVLAAVGAGFLLRSGKPEPAVTDRSAEPPALRAAPPPRPAATPADPVVRFLATNVWSRDSISEFLYEWDQLDPAAQQSLMRTTAFSSFRAQLTDRIRELRALGQRGPESGAGLLIQFAQELAIDPGVGSEDPAIPSVAATGPGTAVPSLAVLSAPPVVDRSAGQPGAADKSAAVVAVAPPRSVAAPVMATPKSVEPPAPAPPPPRLSSGRECGTRLLQTRVHTCWDLLAENVRAPMMIVIPPGQFRMGDDDAPASAPSREVRIDRAFALSAWEVSVADYVLYCRDRSATCPESPWPDPEMPVVGVSWSDARAYAAWLTGRTGHRYRLPSEAEWEYAARAGTVTAFPLGDDLPPNAARFASSSSINSPLPRPDRTTQRNRLGLWHMVGNVREWVADVWHDSHAGSPADGRPREGGGGLRVVRGGSFADPSSHLRSAYREGADASSRDRRTGFRIVQEIDPD